MTDNHDPNLVVGAPSSSLDSEEASSAQGTELTREQFLQSYEAGTIDDDHGLGEEAEPGYRPESAPDRA
ncbi:hypothetical protein P4H65_13035 [Paenibacillus chitinolyticus]|uniref:hypothetical protein n=1 Tax=Paenibacillus chitinolyticus TaxID=79263 RepID=UPI002DBD21A9|nr:hypothetical protein [Paenibacillus chitinolyticus]MEC0246712.1 hypothetical protein [Paenibacillus chitinolyticus]